MSALTVDALTVQLYDSAAFAPDYPATILRRMPNATLLIDRTAASLVL
ncbi:MAG: hypothetical protein WA885_21515 [Phormidesmis sp.]